MQFAGFANLFTDCEESRTSASRRSVAENHTLFSISNYWHWHTHTHTHTHTHEHKKKTLTHRHWNALGSPPLSGRHRHCRWSKNKRRTDGGWKRIRRNLIERKIGTKRTTATSVWRATCADRVRRTTETEGHRPRRWTNRWPLLLRRGPASQRTSLTGRFGPAPHRIFSLPSAKFETGAKGRAPAHRTFDVNFVKTVPN